MFCKNCGNKLEESVKFCNRCGAMQSESAVVKEKAVTPAKNSSSANAVTKAARKPDASVIAAKKAKAKSILMTVAASVFCVCIFLSILSGAGLLTARNVMTPNNIKEVFNKIDSSLMADIISDNGLVEAADYNDDDELIEALVSEESTIPEFVENKITEYGAYLRGGSEPNRIEEDEVVELLMDNEKVRENLVVVFSGEQVRDECERYFQNQIEPELEEFYSDNSLYESRVVLSIWFVVALAVIVAISIFLLIKARQCNLGVLSWIGYTFIAAGGTYLLAFAIIPLITISLDVASSTKKLINILQGSLWPDAILIGGTILVTGALVVVTKIIISKIVAKKKSA